MEKKTKIKAAIYFGMTMAIFSIVLNLLTHEVLLLKTVMTSILSGVFSGALAGLAFGWLIGLFAKSKFVTKGTKIDIKAGETILFQTPANHFKGVEGVGGKLYLTNKRLLFKSHKLNIQNHQLSISLSDIEAVNRYKTLGIVNNGLSVATIANRTEKFVVEQPEHWISQLADKNGLQQLYLQ